MPAGAAGLCQGLLHQVIHRGITAQGESFAVALILDPIGQTHTAHAYATRFGDLALLDSLEGQEVCLQRTPTGLQLMPQAVAQPVCGSSGEPAMAQECPQSSPLDPQEVASTIATVARDFKLPTAVWIHLP